ncbi:MAG: Hsp20/alpha crystallin family protein [Oleiphilaceae bacterium]|nr:Hsp20/alpha crystallin family protein [Oleiphilaceae bacterium]
MDLKKLNPWNWFKHEEKHQSEGAPIPVQRAENDLSRSSAMPEDVHPVLRMHHEMNRLFDEAFRAFAWPSSSADFNWPAFKPRLDVSGSDDGYEISLDVPGYTQDELEIELQDDLLCIRGRKHSEREQKGKHYYRVERQTGQFQRVLNLPEDVAKEGIQARLEQGVLHLDIPRLDLPEKPSRRIEIKHA